jgi:hypothetical protein
MSVGLKHYIYKWTLPADINTETEQCTWQAANMMLRYSYVFEGFLLILSLNCGPGSVVGIATGYELGDPGSESRWGRDFPHMFRPSLGPTQPALQCVPGLSRGKKRLGHDADPSYASCAVGHEIVELYLYSPYGPYGLYRASVPVQGCTLTF